MTFYPNQEVMEGLGGGIALVYKSSIKVNNITHTDQPIGLEYMNVHVKFRNKPLISTLFIDIPTQVFCNSLKLWQIS